MPSSPLPSTISLLPPSPHLLPTLALLFEPGAAPPIHKALLLGSHPPTRNSHHHYSTYHTLITHIRYILLESLLSPSSSSSSSSSSPISTNKNNNINKKNNKGEGVDEAGKENTEAHGSSEIIKQIVNAHPRLGCGAPAAVVRAGYPSSSKNGGIATISELSTKEQAQLQQPAGKEPEEAELLLIRVLNEEYEKKFNGLRFVTFVNGRGREEVLDEMRERLMVTSKGDRVVPEEEEEEMRVAIGAVCDIAEDRVRTLGVCVGELRG